LIVCISKPKPQAHSTHTPATKAQPKSARAQPKP
jgi:hypothetical protein